MSRLRFAVLVVVVAAAAVGAVVPRPAAAQGQAANTDDATPRVMLVVDRSGSMGEVDAKGTVKIEAAKSAILNFLGGLERTSRLGLRTYPDGSGGCDSGRVQFPVGDRDPKDMAAFVRGLSPGGDTPTAEALTAAAADLRNDNAASATLVLVSDGESTCGDPCEAARQIEASGIDIDVVSVGFEISGEGAEELRCIADATGGAYVDAHDGAALEAVLTELARPELELTLQHPATVTADVGLGDAGLVAVVADVRNTGTLAARDVSVRIRFDIGSSPGVVAPVRRLGNLDPGASRSMTWSFRPGLLMAGRSVSFVVIAKAANLSDDLSRPGQVAVVDASRRSDAGPLFREAERVVVMGDSYSSGEGAKEYMPGTDTRENRCHRSPKTYLAPVLDLPNAMVLACSGAISADITHRSESNDVDAQVAQLDRLQKEAGPADAVVLTLGGNDMSFKTLATSCLVFFRDCSEKIFFEDAEPWMETRATSLEGKLRAAYRSIDVELNASDMVRKRGRRAPIVVMAYPRILPSSARSCLVMQQFTRNELDFVSRFVTRVNGEVEGAVMAEAQTGTPTFFVPFVEDAFLPDHTVCDQEPYVNGLGDFDGYDEGAVLLGALTARLPIPGSIERFMSEIQELFHPNVNGYSAMSRAALRWSLTEDGRRAAELSKARPPSKAAARELTVEAVGGSAVSGTVLQPTVSPFSVDAGTSYPLVVTGFAPGTPVELTVRSDPVVVGSPSADEHGRVQTRVRLPGGLDPGRHRIVAIGVAPDGAPHQVEIPLRVGRPGPGVLRSLALATPAAATLVGAVLFGRGRSLARRRDDEATVTARPR